MIFSDIIRFLFPYLYSIRRLKTYISFDMIFPVGWEFPEHIISKLQLTQNDGPDNKKITSIVCQIDDESNINLTIESIVDIVEYNLEREEKEKLLKNKVLELKKLFTATPLEQLKTLKFDVKENEPEYEDEWSGGDVEEILS